MNINKLLKFKLFLFLLLFCGCSSTQEYKYHDWKISIFSPSGELHKEYIVKSVDKPTIHYHHRHTPQQVYTVNRNSHLMDSVLNATNIEVPSQWLIEISE